MQKERKAEEGEKEEDEKEEKEEEERGEKCIYHSVGEAAGFATE